MLFRSVPWLLAIAAVRAVDTLVELDYAKYDGVANDETGVTNWLGMRFAAAPVGDLRFAPPQDPKDEGNDVIDANEVCTNTTCTAGSSPTNNYNSMDSSAAQHLVLVGLLYRRLLYSCSRCSHRVALSSEAARGPKISRMP